MLRNGSHRLLIQCSRHMGENMLGAHPTGLTVRAFPIREIRPESRSHYIAIEALSISSSFSSSSSNCDSLAGLGTCAATEEFRQVSMASPANVHSL